jgi:uncharacterized membrane protein YcaP (DUF421 family)
MSKKQNVQTLTMDQIMAKREQSTRLATEVITNIEDALRLVDSQTRWLLRSMAMMKIEDVEEWVIAEIQKTLEDDKKRKCA